MISVCMATYNGEKYLREQIDSILVNITDSDELIISDDGSTDGTLKILSEYCCDYKNIKIFNGPRLGVVKNFENAIKRSSGDIIFLADQDDIWKDNKVAIMKNVFESHKCWVVVHDANLVNECGIEIMQSFYSLRDSRSGLVKNFVKNSYIGGCMAFKRELFNYAYPFPTGIPMHDWWLGMISELYTKSVFIGNKLISYRRHDNNVSGLHHLPFHMMIRNRWCILVNLLKFCTKNIKGSKL